MLRRSAAVVILFTLALALIAAPATAQTQKGSILVKAVDPQGGAIPGVTVTLTSPVQPGAITGVTDSEGTYRSPTLTVGTYSVKMTLQGFQTIVRENVVVVQNQTVSLDLPMKVGAVSEQVTVTAESPVVDAKNVNVAVNIDKKLLETTPGGKDIWSLLEYKAPGVVADTPDVGQSGRSAARPSGARHTERAEHAAAERRERERPGGAGLRDELLRPDDAGQHPGGDGIAGHHDRHGGHLHQHGDEVGQQQVLLLDADDVPGQLLGQHAGSQHRRPAARNGHSS
jgi:hypothetical protein